MRKRKVKPNTFEDRAIAKAKLEGRADLAKIWKAEEDKELDPAHIEQYNSL